VPKQLHLGSEMSLERLYPGLVLFSSFFLEPFLIFPYIHLVLDGNINKRPVDLTTEETCPVASPAWRRTGRSLTFYSLVAW